MISILLFILGVLTRNVSSYGLEAVMYMVGHCAYRTVKVAVLDAAPFSARSTDCLLPAASSSQSRRGCGTVRSWRSVTRARTFFI